MKSTYQVVTLEGKGVQVELDKDPDECPLCHYNMQPKIIAGTELVTPDSSLSRKFRFVFQCTRRACQEFFIAYYKGTESAKLLSVAPRNPQMADFPKEIEEISCSFIDIYNQALAAEALNLNHIAGIGFGKALEFLVKDFLIHEHPSQADSIKTKFLGQCISEDIKDPNIQACARGAAWLRNDEAHYERRWVDKDIDDLKRLIRLTANWIENTRLTQKYKADMKKHKTDMKTG